jgi:uncharacterized protein (TIGR00251 family)
MSLLVEIKVVPASGKLECTLDKNKAIKCYLKSTPEKRKANDELIKFLSKSIKVPQQNITIVGGEIIRKKQIKIDAELTIEEFYQKMGLK